MLSLVRENKQSELIRGMLGCKKNHLISIMSKLKNPGVRVQTWVL